jgi:hypothetical protein
MANPADYFVAAAITQMRAADNSALGTLEELKKVIEAKFPAQLNEKRLNYLAKLLQGYGFIAVTADEYAGHYITPLTGWGISYRLNKIKETNPSHGVIYVLDGGETLLERAFNNDKFWLDLDARIEEQSTDDFEIAVDRSSDVPASDRIVQRDHNRVEIEVIEADIRSLVDEVTTSNEVSIELGDDKELLAGELKTSEFLIGQPMFRLSTLSNLILPVLRYLSDKFASGAIGELAKRLISALIGLY